MRNLLLVMLGLLPALATPARPAVSPYLKLLERSPRLARAYRQLPPVLSSRPLRRHRQTLVGVLVKSTDGGSLRRAVAALGGWAGRAVGDIVPVRLPLERLGELAALPGVVRIEGRPPRRLLLDISRAEVRADLVEQGTEPLPPLDGRGVLVALVDTGVDYDHPDLSAESSRVLRIWDQFVASGQPPPGQSQGALCDRRSILRKSCDSIDIVGHGTHVTATMASSGTGYRGMAPGADIVAVASIDFTLLVDSVAWLFDQADELGRPMVVNLSLGGHYGPHDGSSLESQALAQLGGPGHIIVAAAGNEGSDFIHLGYDPDGGEGRTRFEVFSGFDVSAALLDIWHDSAADLEFAVLVRRGDTVVAGSDFLSARGQSAAFEFSDGATVLGTVSFEPAGALDPGNGKYQLDIVVEPGEAAFAGNPAGYQWLLAVRGSGYFDAWSAASGFLTPPARFSDSSEGGLIPGDNRRSVGMPAVAPGIVAVASYATRSSWTDADGQQVTHVETSPGQISFFSSRGPSADESSTGPKPLLAAPGEYIVAARSHNAGQLEAGTGIDDEHLAMRGTSMACPHVAGVVALMLQADPQLDPGAVERILRLTARRDEYTGSGDWDERFGYGKLDAREAVAMARGMGICQDDDDCREQLTCQQGRCREAGGCGCGGGRPLGGVLLMLAALLLAGHRHRRRRG